MDVFGVQLFPTGDWPYAFLLLARGLLAVGAIWCALTLYRWRSTGFVAAVSPSLGEAVLAAGIIAIWAMTVAPLRHPMAGLEDHMPVNLVPVLPLVDDLLSKDRRMMALPNLIANVALYVPLGIGLRLRFATRPRWVLVIAVCLSSTVETWQAVSDQLRSSDINDVLLNTSGALIGAWSAPIAVRSLSRRRGDATGSPTGLDG